MNLLFLLVYFIIITAVIEIYVVLFRLTGLNLKVSRFQVISLMTGTGFTTEESELILGHPIRRKLATFLILFGAFSLAVIISTISNFLSGDLRMIHIFYIAGGVMLVFGVLKLACIQNLLSKLFHREMKQQMELGDLPIRDVFLTEKNDFLLNLHIYTDSLLVYKTINQLFNDQERPEFIVLFIKRGQSKIRCNIYNEKLQEGDQLLLYGDKEAINKLFQHDIRIMKKKLKNQQPPTAFTGG
ncbi:TrkA C-terminal domain-containing protein [Neobacillus sp. MER 74]|uniref:TrkA C-terminal domain-containing protein n=1 Tax=Neobacillus sp. MER 74 TaxID=2939566 RepID=UPI00203D96A5|nr:TrkA C-terminal domain-containing protein [Neobacillus sp. MER 74]MCM3116140.1 TrkA C-terminal domain-containing protein [Neobacillus sp. MER 74]